MLFAASDARGQGCDSDERGRGAGDRRAGRGRRQLWVVSDKALGGVGNTLQDQLGVEGGRSGETLSVIREIEPARRLLRPGRCRM